jgi:hypothetical protein
MSPEIHRLFSPEIRNQCFSRFGVTTARLVSSRHAFIFDAETAAGPCILKVVHPAHRPYDQLEAEIDWIYTVATKMLDLNNLTPIQARLLAERGNRIRKNQPIVDLGGLLKSF